GISLMRLKTMAEAEPLVREAYDRRRRVLGDDHPDTLETASNLGFILPALGQVDQGLELQSRVLEQRRKMFGDDHPATLASLARLAQTFAGISGRTAEAITLHRELLARQQKLMGQDNPATLGASLTLANLLIRDQ